MSSDRQDTAVSWAQRIAGWLMLLIAVLLLIAAAAGVALDQALEAVDRERGKRVKVEEQLDKADDERAALERRVDRLAKQVEKLGGTPDTGDPPASSGSSSSDNAGDDPPASSTDDGDDQAADRPAGDRRDKPAEEEPERPPRRDEDDGEGSPDPEPSPCTVDLGIVKLCPDT